MWKQFVVDYLSFSKKERHGITVLLFLIILFSTLPVFYPFFIKTKIYDHSSFAKEIALLKIKEGDSATAFTTGYKKEQNGGANYSSSEYVDYNKVVKGELFYFDPNTASADEWRKLGIRDKTIITLQKYIAKGGKFYKPEDIGKIWGLHASDVKRLLPFVKIQPQFASTTFVKKTIDERQRFEKPTYAPAMVDINTADTTTWIALPGIGSKISQRIVNFREKLGGFYKVEQVGETFGLADSTFQKIKPILEIGTTPIRQININTATLDEMKVHPYIKYNLANPIVAYRNEHGAFSKIEDIKKVVTVTDEIYKKIEPYLSLQ